MSKIAFLNNSAQVYHTATVALQDWRSTSFSAPEGVVNFLAKLRMLDQVPFNNIVPDTDLLPPESIRFFYLDRAWTDALVQGALSVATRNEYEHAQLERLYGEVQDEVDKAERQVRMPGGEPELSGSSGQVTGLLLRSLAVAGWPGLHVRAYSVDNLSNDEEIVSEADRRRIKLLRMERLAPSVLLVLFDGVPELVHIEEPRQGVQFGAKLAEDSPGRKTASVPARSVETGAYVVNGVADSNATASQADKVPVKFRTNVSGVIDMTNTANAFLAAEGTKMNADGRVDGAEFALQMIRFPARQVFGEDGQTPVDDSFRPTVVNVAKQFTGALKRDLGGL